MGNNIFAGAVNGIYKSADNGYSWSQTSFPNMTVHCLGVQNGVIFACSDALYKSTDNGMTWSVTTLVNPASSILIVDNFIFAGTNSGIYQSTNSGANWTHLNFSYSTYSFAVSGNNIFVGTAGYGVYLSTNNGVNWIQKNQGFGLNPIVFSFLISNNNIYSGLAYNSVWRRSLSEIIGIQNVSTEIPSSFSLCQNYPNPFNPETKIRFSIPLRRGDGGWNTDGVGIVRLTVYDALGREVETLINEALQPGTYEVTFNGSKYNSGVYFYRLMTDGFTETKRMILLK